MAIARIPLIKTILILIICISPLRLCSQSAPTQLTTRAQSTHYEETSRYDDVIRYIEQLQQASPLIRLEMMGKTVEGRPIPLMVLADPPIADPRAALESGKPIVFVIANIHAGEVEGKEASLDLANRLLLGDLRPLLTKLVILIAPDYNADGNEKISTDNRIEQNGPIGGVGVRENSMRLDLNRDYMKLAAPETRALVSVLCRWDPHLVIDLHTTDGSYHGYHLTYSIPLNPATNSGIAQFQRQKMMPALSDAMLSKHKFRTYYYGNFEGRAPREGQPDTRSWHAFSGLPRVGTNYVGMRNRLAILSEAYSYLHFKGRVDVTEAFVEEILHFGESHAQEVREVTAHADMEATRRGLQGPALQLGLDLRATPLPDKVDILVGEVTKLKNPRSGRMMTAVVPDKVTAVKMLDYGTFTAARTIPTAAAYLLPNEPGTKAAIENLRLHGIAVDELSAPLKVQVQQFVVDNITRTTRAFLGGREVKLAGHYTLGTVEFPTGAIVVRAAQPLGPLASYLLEPESDDGLTTWGFFDASVEKAKAHPVSKLMKSMSFPAQTR